MKKPRKRAVARAGDVVAEVLAARGALEAVREHRLVTGWTDIVGERVAARTWPDGLKNGVLFVRVANSAWLQELSFLLDALADKANRLAGDPPLVKSVRLHLHARPDADADDVVAALAARRRPRPIPRPRPPIDPATRARIDAEADRVTDAELRETIRALRIRLGL